jgi:hypothetical protein
MRLKQMGAVVVFKFPRNVQRCFLATIFDVFVCAKFEKKFLLRS